MRFSLYPLTSLSFFSILQGTLVAIVSASDPDGDRVLYQLGTDANRKFRINKNTGEIFLNQKLDREKLVRTIYDENLERTIFFFCCFAPLKCA